MTSIYRIATSGNWCQGIYWKITNVATGNTVHESGPYHYQGGRKIAWDDAVEYAWRNDLPLESSVN